MSYPVVPNIAAGRANELYRRVKVGDPSTSRIVVVAFKTMPSEAADFLLAPPLGAAT